MKKADVELGKTYVVKVSGHLVPVRLEAVSSYGGWVGRNLHTNREVHIRSAMRLRRPAGPNAAEVARITRDVARGVPVAVKDRRLDPEHRARYPEQYAHPLVGKRVRFIVAGETRTGVVLRVFNTRTFGELAAIDTLAPTEAVAVASLEHELTPRHEAELAPACDCMDCSVNREPPH